MIVQLMHVGRASLRADKEAHAATVVPSAVASRDPIPRPDGLPATPELPLALPRSAIAAIVSEYAEAARNARATGMDGVELHCTSGYLPMQFLSSNANQRTDRYGGSPTNRARFVIETMEALADAIGADRVRFRIFPGNPFNDIVDDDPSATYAALFGGLTGLDLAYCHLIHYPTPALDALTLVRRHWQGPIIANNNLDGAAAERLLAGGVDAVSFGRSFVANPDLAERLSSGAPLARADRRTFCTDEERGYTDYPSLDWPQG